MNCFTTLDEVTIGDLNIYAYKYYAGYDDSIVYGAAVMSFDTCDDVEEITCTSEEEAMAAYERLIEKYKED